MDQLVQVVIPYIRILAARQKHPFRVETASSMKLRNMSIVLLEVTSNGPELVIAPCRVGQAERRADDAVHDRVQVIVVPLWVVLHEASGVGDVVPSHVAPVVHDAGRACS